MGEILVEQQAPVPSRHTQLDRDRLVGEILVEQQAPVASRDT